jgi:hypothetical protein
VQDLDWPGRRLLGVATKVGVQLSVGEPGRRAMGPVQREVGLPDTAHAHDHHGAVVGRGRGERRELGVPAGEPGDVERQLRGHRSRWPLVVGPQRATKRVVELGSRTDPELLAQAGADQMERRDRLGLPARPGQSVDQQGVHRLVERVPFRQGLQDLRGRGRLARREQGLAPGEGRDAQLTCQARDHRRIGTVGWHVGEGDALPQSQGLTEGRRTLSGRERSRCHDHGAEPGDVGGQVLRRQSVAGRGPADVDRVRRRGPQPAAQPVHRDRDR